MVSEKIVLTAPNGMHARPAGDLVKLAKGLDGKVMLATAVKSVNASSMLAVLSLGLKSGTEITVTADGEAKAVFTYDRNEYTFTLSKDNGIESVSAESIDAEILHKYWDLVKLC